MPRFSTHATRHLCLTDLARMGWELHAIASFAGHRSTESTLKYIHLSGRDLADKLQGHGPHSRLAGRAARRRRFPLGGPAVTHASQAAALQAAAPARPWSLERVGYDRSAALTTAEQNALEALGLGNCAVGRTAGVIPVKATGLRCTGWSFRSLRPGTASRCRRRTISSAARRPTPSLWCSMVAPVARSFWAWDAAAWAEVLGPSRKVFQGRYPGWADSSARTYAIALAYVFGFTELNLLGNVGRAAVARKVFGSARVGNTVGQVTSVLHGWGRRSPQVTVRTESLVCHALLLNRSPLLADLSAEVLQDLRSNTAVPYSLRQNVHSLHRALAALGLTSSPPPPARLACPPVEGVASAWAGWVQRWHDTSPLPPRGRKGQRNQMLRMGRWLAAEHPEVQEPGQWTRGAVRRLGRRGRPARYRGLHPGRRLARKSVSASR